MSLWRPIPGLMEEFSGCPCMQVALVARAREERILHAVMYFIICERHAFACLSTYVRGWASVIHGVERDEVAFQERNITDTHDANGTAMVYWQDVACKHAGGQTA
jgi:hypothetical protein